MRAAPLVLALLSLVLATPALAQQGPVGTPTEADVSRAKELFDNGQILYDEGRYEDAITAWLESYRLSGYPDLLYNISGAYEKLGQYETALDVLDKYRVYATADERATLDRRMKSMEERLAAQKAAAAATVTTPPPDTTTTPVVTTPVVTTPVQPPPPVVPERRSSPLPIALFAVGGASLGFGAFEGVQAMGAMGRISESCVAQDDGYVCRDDSEPDVAKHGRASTMSAISIGAGTALVALGAVTLTLGGASDVAIVPTAGGGSVVYARRF